MTARMDVLNMLYRDFKVAEDVSKMMELRRFDVEFTVYGSRLLVDGQAKYLVSTQRDTIAGYVNQRENFTKWPLPVESYTLMTAVPAGNEEDILRLTKITLAKRLRESYDAAFLEELYALAAIENDDAAEGILTELMTQLEGLFCLDGLILFAGLMDKACRAKHLTASTLQRYTQWLELEYQQLEGRSSLTDQFAKKLYGIAYAAERTVKVYCNAESAKVYEKQAQLAQKQILVSAVYGKTYWYNYETTIGEIRAQFEAHLQTLCDAAYFSYLRRIDQLEARVPPEQFRACAARHGAKNAATKRALASYQAYWGIKNL